MSIVVPLDSSGPWQLVIESALELTELVPSDLEIVLSSNDTSFRNQVEDFITGKLNNPLQTVSYVNTVPASANLTAFNPRMAILAMSAPDGDPASYRDVVENPLGWRGQLFLVPLDTDVLHTAFAERMIVVIQENADVDTIEPWATWIARTANSQVSLLTVLAADNENGLASRLSVAQNRLRERAEQLRTHGLRTAWEVRIGESAEEVIRMAETTGTHLILLPKTIRNFACESLLDTLVNHGRLHLLLTA